MRCCQPILVLPGPGGAGGAGRGLDTSSLLCRPGAELPCCQMARSVASSAAPGSPGATAGAAPRPRAHFSTDGAGVGEHSSRAHEGNLG